MKQFILTILVALICLGCSSQETYPASRLQQPSGDFSYVTPNNWFRTKLFGIDYIIVSAEADHGLKPNIYVDFVKADTKLDEASKKLTSIYESKQRPYRIESKGEFETESGLAGIKITATRKNKEDLPLATYQYLIHDSGRTIAITCTCASSVKRKYEPKFDQAIKSLKSEN